MSAGIRVTARLEEEPCPPLGFVDPDFDKAGARNVAVLIADVMCLA